MVATRSLILFKQIGRGNKCLPSIVIKKLIFMTLKSWITTDRSSLLEVFCKKGVLRNFAKFAGKHLCHSCFFNKVFLLKNRLWHRCFPVNFSKFIRTPFFTEHLQCQSIGTAILPNHAKIFVNSFGQNLLLKKLFYHLQYNSVQLKIYSPLELAV